MRRWEERPSEVAYLLNPAFCGEVIRRCIRKYQETSGAMPYPLVFLVLPIVLHKKTRERVVPRKQMHTWVQENQDVRLGFGDRARQLLRITSEALTFLIQTGAVTIDEHASLTVVKGRRRKVPEQRSGEIEDCYSKAELVGRWFSRSGTVATIFTMWGVKP